MGIAFPRKETSDRIRDLHKLILEKVEIGGVDEFCKWARSVHGNVIDTMPAQVETKCMAFTDSTATANDRITGETSIISFRATAKKNGVKGNAHYDPLKPGILFPPFENFKFIIFSGMGKC